LRSITIVRLHGNLSCDTSQAARPAKAIEVGRGFDIYIAESGYQRIVYILRFIGQIKVIDRATITWATCWGKQNICPQDFAPDPNINIVPRKKVDLVKTTVSGGCNVAIKPVTNLFAIFLISPDNLSYLTAFSL
jgi:hypothetical protein